MNPVISIIIPSLNDLNNLKKNILSIQFQIYNKYEVFVIDGGSTDGSIDFLQKLKKPFYWESNTDNGIFDAMNKGVKKANGKWILFLGTDDQLYNEKVLNNIFANKKHKQETDLILGSIQYNFDKDDSLWIKRKSGIFKPTWSGNLWFRNTVHHQGMFYKKDLIMNNPFSTQYSRLSDYALNIFFYKNGISVNISDKIISLCGTKGVSKQYNWSLYKQEIELKVEESNVYFKPFFYLLVILKYSIKNIEKLFKI